MTFTLRASGEVWELLRTEEFGAATPVGAISTSPAWLLAQVLRHAPATPAEVEAAIEHVEEAVMPLHARVPVGETLLVDAALDASVATLFAIARAESINAEALEALFSRAVAIPLGRPALAEPELARPDVFASLLLLRELVHHLGFQAVARIGAAGFASSGSNTLR